MIRNLRLHFNRLIDTVSNNTPNMTDSHTPCPICFEELGETNIAVMECGHKFHFKCMVKWNSTDNGDTCPMCRADLGLPDMVDSSDEEDEDILHIRDFDHDLGEGQFRFRDDLRTTSLNDIESDEDEDEDTQEELREKRNELMEFIESMSENEFKFSVKCDSCSQSIMLCNFCNEPLCACKNTEDKPQFKANPFNKFYNSHFDPKQRDDEMLEILQIENPSGDDLMAPCVCSRCFANRDAVTKATIDSYVSEEDETITLDTFKKPEMRAIYYNLYLNNSGVDNPQILRRFPSFETIELFREYIIHKYSIQIQRPDIEADIEPVETSTPLSSSPRTPTNSSIPEPSEPPRITRQNRVPYRDSSQRGGNTISFRINTAPLPQQNTSFTQYDNEDIFVRVDDILAMRERYRIAMEEEVAEREVPDEVTEREVPEQEVPEQEDYYRYIVAPTRPTRIDSQLFGNIRFRPPTPPRPNLVE